jgi:hypothetical protein
MSLQVLTQINPSRFFDLPKSDGTDIQRLNTQVEGIAVSNDFSGRLSVTTAEGDRITLTADLETDFRAINFRSQSSTGGTAVGVEATYREFAYRNELNVAVEGNLSEQELQDLETVFQKASNIFRHFIKGQDEVSLAKVAHLADRFASLPSLASIDLALDLDRSVTQVAAQIASEYIGQGTGETLESSSPNRTAAPTPSSTPALISDSDKGIRFGLPDSIFSGPSSLTQQILDILQESRLKPRKIHEHLPSLLARLREQVGEELHREQAHKNSQPNEPAKQTQTPLFMNAAIARAYESARESSVSLSRHN